MKVCLLLFVLVAVAGVSEGQLGGLTLDLLGGICNLREFINLKCPGKDNTDCVVCVFQKVIRSCPYDFLSGPPDCKKQMECGKNLSFNC